MSILSLVRSGNGFASGRLSYGQASTYRPCPTYYVTVLVFVCPYVCMTLEHPCRAVRFFLIVTVWTGVTATVFIGVSTALAHLCTIFWSILSRSFAIYKHAAQISLWWCGGWFFCEIIPHVFTSWFPINEKFFLFYPFLHPIKSHVHWLGLFLSNYSGDNAFGRGVVCFYWGWWLGKTEFMECNY